MPSYHYFALVVTETLLILCFYTNYYQTLWHHQLSNLHNTKSWISLEREKISGKGKHHLSSFWKAFHISSTSFSFHRHFKVNYLFKHATRFHVYHACLLAFAYWLPASVNWFKYDCWQATWGVGYLWAAVMNFRGACRLSFASAIQKKNCGKPVHRRGWHGGVMVSVLDSGSNGPGLSLGQGTVLCS